MSGFIAVYCLLLVALLAPAVAWDLIMEFPENGASYSDSDPLWWPRDVRLVFAPPSADDAARLTYNVRLCLQISTRDRFQPDTVLDVRDDVCATYAQVVATQNVMTMNGPLSMARVYHLRYWLLDTSTGQQLTVPKTTTFEMGLPADMTLTGATTRHRLSPRPGKATSQCSAADGLTGEWVYRNRMQNKSEVHAYTCT